MTTALLEFLKEQSALANLPSKQPDYAFTGPAEEPCPTCGDTMLVMRAPSTDWECATCAGLGDGM